MIRGGGDNTNGADIKKSQSTTEEILGRTFKLKAVDEYMNEHIKMNLTDKREIS